MNCCACRNVRRRFVSPCDKGSARLEWKRMIFSRLFGFVFITSLHLILTSEAFSRGQITKDLGGFIVGRSQLHIFKFKKKYNGKLPN